jgi:manganese efflux pump family protein
MADGAMMELGWLAILGLSVGLAMDAFAVALAAGMTLDTVTPRHVFRLGFHFGLFQFMMPIIGWLAGAELSARVGDYDHWLAFALLAGVGGKMLWEAGCEKDADAGNDPTRGLRLLTLSVATSLDALAVGVSMALVGVSVWIPSVVIGVVTATMTATGIVFGGRIGSRWGRWADLAGGIVLIVIGIKVLTTG